MRHKHEKVQITVKTISTIVFRFRQNVRERVHMFACAHVGTCQGYRRPLDFPELAYRQL